MLGNQWGCAQIDQQQHALQIECDSHLIGAASNVTPNCTKSRISKRLKWIESNNFGMLKQTTFFSFHLLFGRNDIFFFSLIFFFWSKPENKCEFYNWLCPVPDCRRPVSDPVRVCRRPMSWRCCRHPFGPAFDWLSPWTDIYLQIRVCLCLRRMRVGRGM